MFINNNSIASKLYVPYTQRIRSLGESAHRLATGKKMPSLAQGAGEVGLADRFQQTVRGNAKLLVGVQNSSSFVAVQGELLQQAGEIIQRMSELAASALDTTKNTSDRASLNVEFQALANEIIDMSAREYNGLSVFGALSIRFDIGNSGSPKHMTSLSQIGLGGIDLTGRAISQLTSAQTAMASISDRLNSLNILKARSGYNANKINRIIDFSRNYQKEITDAENLIRGVDIAVEAGEYTKQQVLLSASQSVLSQANGLLQSALQFLGY